METREVLVFDWGVSVLGVLDVNGNKYIPYHYGEDMIRGARRLISSSGTIVSFNGNKRDLMEISKILKLSSPAELQIAGEHNDMLEITSEIRWPPDPGTGSILGPGLSETYRYYFGDQTVAPPSHLEKEYEGELFKYVESNWRDCYMTAELWKKWQHGELKP
jgi:hypothetical protein